MIWTGFRPIGNTERKNGWADYEQLLRADYSCFTGQKKFLILTPFLEVCKITEEEVSSILYQKPSCL